MLREIDFQIKNLLLDPTASPLWWLVAWDEILCKKYLFQAEQQSSGGRVTMWVLVWTCHGLNHWFTAIPISWMTFFVTVRQTLTIEMQTYWENGTVWSRFYQVASEMVISWQANLIKVALFHSHGSEFVQLRAALFANKLSWRLALGKVSCSIIDVQDLRTYIIIWQLNFMS